MIIIFVIYKDLYMYIIVIINKIFILFNIILFFFFFVPLIPISVLLHLKKIIQQLIQIIMLQIPHL